MRGFSFSKKVHCEKSWQYQEDDFCIQQESFFLIPLISIPNFPFIIQEIPYRIDFFYFMVKYYLRFFRNGFCFRSV